MRQRKKLSFVTAAVMAATTLGVSVAPAGAAREDRNSEGRRLFDEETFGGNGRTCLTCHSVKSGTISPADVRRRLPLGDPLFIHDGLDDGVGGTSRIEAHATIRVEIPLPAHIRLKPDSGATHVVFNRGVPSTQNTPALDPALMYDGRAANLQDQARGAIHGHAQNSVEPTAEQLELIAHFQQTDKRFFSSGKLRNFAKGKSPPRLPEGDSASEQRGRAMFDDVPIDPDTKAGICAICHSGPMLNRFNEHNPFGAPPGAAFGNILVSERNLLNNPVYTFVVTERDGTTVEVTTPDPGVLLTDPPPPEFPPFLPRSFTANFFKIPQLWGVSETAPYFHDNSAKTLAEVAEQYDFFFRVVLGFELSAQDQADIVAFLELLDGDDDEQAELENQGLGTN